jgi:hypothetical protein
LCIQKTTLNAIEKKKKAIITEGHKWKGGALLGANNFLLISQIYANFISI